jgi:hypothetical protein
MARGEMQFVYDENEINTNKSTVLPEPNLGGYDRMKFVYDENEKAINSPTSPSYDAKYGNPEKLPDSQWVGPA